MRQLLETLRRARGAHKSLAPYGRRHRRFLHKGLIATVVLVGARLAFPWPLRGLMELVFRAGAPGRADEVVVMVPPIGDPVGWLVAGFLAIIFTWALSESIQRLSFTRYAVGLAADIRTAALARLPFSTHRDPGDLISAITGDISRVKTGVKSILIGGLRNGTFFVGVAIIVGWIDPLIGLVFLGSGVASIVVGILGAWRASRPALGSRKREGAFTAILHGFLNGDNGLPLAAVEPKRPDSKVTRIEGTTTVAIHIVLAIFTCAILILTIEAGRTGKVSPGSVFTILAYTMLMHNKTVIFGRRMVRGGRLLPSAERVAALAGTFGENPEAAVKLDPSGDVDDAGLILAGGEVAGFLGGSWTGPTGASQGRGKVVT